MLSKDARDMQKNWRNNSGENCPSQPQEKSTKWARRQEQVEDIQKLGPPEPGH
jgi:hypothetical protein